MRVTAERMADRKAKATMTGAADAYDDLAKETELRTASERPKLKWARARKQMA
jgi:hypothetical protein